ncbi:hypothetical protein MKX01_001715 [Papaver californicum]|nr:hypothetical protein MKX01_001715 [Papaver californicum]
MRCKDAGMSSGFHVSHDRKIDQGTSSSVSLNRGDAPELAQVKGRRTHTQSRSIKEPGKGSVRHDRGLFTATTNEKTLDLRERREGAIDLVAQHNWISSTLNRNDKGILILNNEAPEAPMQNKMIKIDSHSVDKRKWFKEFTWEEKLDCAYSNRTLVPDCRNLNPSYSAAEIEEIMLTYLKVRCTAEVLPQCTFSSPHNGQAFLIFKTEEKAEMVIKQLRDRFLMLPNGRPLIAQRGDPRLLPEKSANFLGQFTIERSKNREKKNAVSTSHCAQSNTVEYELALYWILQQRQSEASRHALFELHGKELAALKAQLKKH